MVLALRGPPEYFATLATYNRVRKASEWQFLRPNVRFSGGANVNVVFEICGFRRNFL